MLVCIVSDTHENVPVIELAVKSMQALRPDVVIHCGDIISPPVLRHFAPLPMRFVYGNNDGERQGLQTLCHELGFGEIADELELSLLDQHALVYHGTRANVLDERILSQRYDFIFTGHTHTTRDETIGKTRIINPGALFACKTYTFASLRLPEGKLEFHPVR